MNKGNGGLSYGTDVSTKPAPGVGPSWCSDASRKTGAEASMSAKGEVATSNAATPLSPMSPGTHHPRAWRTCCCLRRPQVAVGVVLGLVLVCGLVGLLFSATNREELSLVALVLGVACVVQTASLLLALLSPPYRKSRAKQEDELEEREGEERTLRKAAALSQPELIKALGSHTDNGLSREEAGRRLSALRHRGHYSSYSPWLQQQWHSPHDACYCSTEALDPTSASPPPLSLLAQALHSELWALHTPLLWGLALVVALQQQTGPGEDRATGQWVAGLAEVGLSLTLGLAYVLLNAFRTWTTLRCVWSVQAGKGCVRLGPVRVVRGGDVVELRQSRLVPGDIVLLRPGQEVPAHVRLLHTWGSLELKAPPSHVHKVAPAASKARPSASGSGSGNGGGAGGGVDKSGSTSGGGWVGPYARLCVQEPHAAPGTTTAYKTNIAPAGSLVRRGRARGVVVLRPAHPPPPSPLLVPPTPSMSVDRLQDVEWGLTGLAAAVSALVLVLGLLPVGQRKEESTGRGMVLLQGLGGGLALLWALLPHSMTRLPAEVMARGLCSIGGVTLGEKQLGVEAAVEALARADVLVLDKAGTLTEGRPRLREVVTLDMPSPPSPLTNSTTATVPSEDKAAFKPPHLQVTRMAADGERLHKLLQAGAASSVEPLLESWLLTCAFADASPAHKLSPPDPHSSLPLQELLELEHEWDGLGPFDRAVLRAIVGLPEPAATARCVSASSSAALSALLHDPSSSPKRPMQSQDEEVLLLPALLDTLPGLSMRSPLTSATSPRLLPPPVCSLLLRKLRTHTLVAEVPWDPRLRFQARSYAIQGPKTDTPLYRTYFRGSAEALLAHCSSFRGPSSPKVEAASLRTSLLAAVEELGRQGYSVQGLAVREEHSLPLPSGRGSQGPIPTTGMEGKEDLPPPPQGPVTITTATRALLDGCTFIGLLAFEDRVKPSAVHASAMLTTHRHPSSSSSTGAKLRLLLVTGEGSAESATALAHRTGLLTCLESSSGLKQGDSCRARGDEEAGLVVYDHLMGHRHPQVLSCSELLANTTSPLDVLHDRLMTCTQQGADPVAVLYKATPHDRVLVVRALVSGGHKVMVTGNGLGDVAAMAQQGATGVVLGNKNNATCTDAARHAAALLLDDTEPEALADVLVECRRLLSLLASVTRLELASRLGLGLLGLVLAVPYGFPLQTHVILALALARSVAIMLLLLPPSGRAGDGLGAFMLPCCSKAAAITEHAEHELDSSDEDESDSDSDSDDGNGNDSGTAAPGRSSRSSHAPHHSSTELHVPSLLWQSLLLSLPLLLCALPLPLLMHERLPTSSTPPLPLLLLTALLVATPLLPSVVLRPRPLHWHYHSTQASVCATLLVLSPLLLLGVLYPALPPPALLLLLVSPLLPLLLLLAVRRTRVWHWPPCYRRLGPLGHRPRSRSHRHHHQHGYGTLGNKRSPSHMPITPLSHPTAASIHYSNQQAQYPFLLLHPPAQASHAAEGPGAGVFFNAPSPTTWLLSQTQDS